MNQKSEIVVDFRMHQNSGIGRYIRNLIPFLLDKYNITLIGNLSELQNYDWVSKVKIIHCKAPIYSIKEQIEIFRKTPKCEVFWTPHYNIPLLPIRAKKRIATIHDVYHLAFQRTLSLPQKIYAKFMINQAVKKSDVILTVSNFSKNEIIKYTKTTKDIKVIYNGIESFWIENKPLSLNKRENYVLYVGNIKPHKNLVRALKAFLLLNNKDLKFKIIGKKEGFIIADKEIEKIAQQLGNRVEFTGQVNDEKLKDFYKKAKLFIFPSLYEGFGLPPLEAMACGTPVIVSNTTSLPEVCGDAAYYINPYDINDIAKGIETVLKNENLQKELIEKGLKRVKLFSWEKSAKKLIKVIEGLV